MLLPFVFLVCLIPIGSAIDIQCQGTETDDLTSLKIQLGANNGVELLASVTTLRPDNSTSVRTQREILFENMLHLENGDDTRKQFIVANKSSGLVASMDKSKADCKSITPVASWDKTEFDLVCHVLLESQSATGLVDNHEVTSLGWILANADQYTWYKNTTEDPLFDHYSACTSDSDNDESKHAIRLSFFKLGSDAGPSLDAFVRAYISNDNYVNDFNIFEFEIIQDMDPVDFEQDGAFQPPEGIFCPNYLPKGQLGIEMPDEMSLSTEIIDIKSQKVSYTTEFYDYSHRLSRIELHSAGDVPGFVHPGDMSRKTDPVKIIHDFMAGFEFWIDLETEECGIQSTIEHDNKDANVEPGKTLKNKTDPYTYMKHPRDIYNFNSDDMQFVGRCASSASITGYKWLRVDSRHNISTVACISDGTFDMHADGDNSAVPLFIKKYNISAPRVAPEFAPQLVQIINFYDVQLTAPDFDIFALSACKDVTHFLLKGTHNAYAMIEGSADKDGNPSYSDQEGNPHYLRMKAMEDMIRDQLSEKFGVAKIRFIDLFVEFPRGKKKDIIIGFGIVDVDNDPMIVQTRISDPMHKVEGVNERQYMPVDSLNVLGNMTKLIDSDQFSIDFVWNDYDVKEDPSAKSKMTSYSQKIRIQKAEQLTPEAFESRLPKAVLKTEEKSGGGIGPGAVIATALCMALLGAAAGLATGWKLWKSSGSFGYTIHTNI